MPVFDSVRTFDQCVVKLTSQGIREGYAIRVCRKKFPVPSDLERAEKLLAGELSLSDADTDRERERSGRTNMLLSGQMSLADFDESKVKRDGGKFASKGGGGSKPEKQPGVKKDRTEVKGTKKFKEVEFKEARSKYRESKGTSKSDNLAVIEASGVSIKAPKGLEDESIEALAHVVGDGKFTAKLLSKMTVDVKELSRNVHGTSKRGLILVNAESVKEHGPGFGAAIIRHELEHAVLTAKGIPNAQQEHRVQHTTATWATIKEAGMAKTNPVAAEGFRVAAKESRS